MEKVKTGLTDEQVATLSALISAKVCADDLGPWITDVVRRIERESVRAVIVPMNRAEARADAYREALLAAEQFLDPDTPRGKYVYGWQNTVDLVRAALAGSGKESLAAADKRHPDDCKCAECGYGF